MERPVVAPAREELRLPACLIIMDGFGLAAVSYTHLNERKEEKEEQLAEDAS